ncbi:MAG: hypothetical protein EOO13_18935, partial [Chitinophagaceae bacterium]
MTWKTMFASCLFLLCLHFARAQDDRAGLMKELDKAIAESATYDALKHESIRRIKNSFEPLINPSAGSNKLALEYDYYEALYDQYKIFRFDTAYIYAKQLEDIAVLLKDGAKLSQAKIKLMFVLVSAGMFNEASELMKEINISAQPDSIKAHYYALKARYYYDLGDFVNDHFHTPQYYAQASINLDSAVLFYQPGSFESVYQHGLRSLKMDSLQ